ncbi:MAG TPA: quinoprotein relay system zinc metallohydrolase 2 [Xanthobacteraceae bacterium]
MMVCGIRLAAHSQEPAEPLAVSEVAAGVFMHTGALALMTRANEGGIANIGFVVGSEAVAVIDTGGSVREGRRLLAAVRARTAKPIRYVVATHGHPDHIFGHAAFESEGAVFIGHHNLPRALAMRGQFYLDAYRRLMGEEIMADVKIIPPSRLVDATATLDLGARRLVLKAWQTAHTDSDLTVFDEASGSLFAGDLVVARHVPVLDGSILGWLSVLDELARMQSKRILPGHGPVIEDWQGALAEQRRYLERLTADVRSLISRGAPISTAARSAGEAEKDRWSLFEEYNARNATAAFAELEWE